MNDSEKQMPDFVLKRTSSPAEAVSLLIRRFPMIVSLGESQKELIETGPYYSYGKFAGEVARNAGNGDLVRRFASFIDELAESKDSLLEDVLITSVLEKIAEDPAFSRQVRNSLGLQASTMLKRVEADLFGRTPR